MRFSAAIKTRKKAGAVPVIPDIKCISPKEGDLLRGRDPVSMAVLLAEAGAPALSVVTAAKDFGGSLKLLEQIVQKTRLPVLRKDFIRSIDDLKVTKDSGASAVLLICAALPTALLLKLYEETIKMELEPLVETHTKEEIILARKMGAKLIGINNRNILELEKDEGNVSKTGLLAKYKPKDAILISESSIKTSDEVRSAVCMGADGVLVGTAIWQSENTVDFYRELSEALGDKT